MPKALCCCEDKSKKAVLFCAANMYIIDGFLSSWIKTNVETYTIVLASRIGVSDGLYEKYQDIANSSTRIQLFWIDTFEISFWRRAWSYDFSLLKESIRKQREYSQIFFLKWRKLCF